MSRNANKLFAAAISRYASRSLFPLLPFASISHLPTLDYLTLHILKPLQHQLTHCSRRPLFLRSFAASAYPKQPSQDLEGNFKFARIFAFIFILGAAYRIIPMAVLSLVPHALKLLEGDKTYYLSAGLGRLSFMLSLEAARAQAIEEGAVERVVEIVEKCVKGIWDEKLLWKALEVLVKLVEGQGAAAEEGKRRLAAKQGAEHVLITVLEGKEATSVHQKEVRGKVEELVLDLRRERKKREAEGDTKSDYKAWFWGK